MSEPLETRLDRLGTLTDPVRRSVFEYVVESARPVTREETATATGISRSLATYHLERLVEERLLTSGFGRRVGGPGAGRPPRVYERATTEVAVSIPPRDDELPARLLARAVVEAGAEKTAFDYAREAGHALGAEVRRRTDGGVPTDAHPGDRRRLVTTLRDVLAERGYEPFDDGTRVLMRNCPFDHLTGEHRELVCGMNLALLEGLVDGLGLDGRRAVLDPEPGRCCVTMPLP